APRAGRFRTTVCRSYAPAALRARAKLCRSPRPCAPRGAGAADGALAASARPRVQPPVHLVDRIDRAVMADAIGLHDTSELIVEDERSAVHVDDQDGMGHAEIVVLQNDE